MFYRARTNLMKRIQKLRSRLGNRKGVALMMVLAALATLGVFVGEITYTSQINQKLAYDRLDQIKAHSLAKSGLRIALLRIRAYAELKKTVSSYTGNNAAAKAAANSIVPKAILEKIWAEPITIPFTGDISALPLSIRDSLTKFRKESGMEGKLYISIEAQSSKFNLNSILPAVAAAPSASPSPNGGTGSGTGDTDTGTASPTPTATPAEDAQYSPDSARQLLVDHIKQIFAKKFEESEKFREQYRNFKVEDLVQEIIGWADLTYETIRSQQAPVPFKMAPYYDISELHYLGTVDDEVYDLIAPQFNAGMSQGINVNSIKDAVLKGLVPDMTDEERKAFFEFRDAAPPEDNTFKTADDFYKYITEKVAAYKGVKSKMDDFKKALSQRGIQIITEESHFKIRIEATVQQTKRTLEAWVSVIDGQSTGTPSSVNGQPTPTPSPTPVNNNQNANGAGTPANTTERSTLKITQIRFL